MSQIGVLRSKLSSPEAGFSCGFDHIHMVLSNIGHCYVSVSIKQNTCEMDDNCQSFKLDRL